jgi:hypothetical protein
VASTGDVLLATSPWSTDPARRILRSTDARRWTPVDLPGAPERLELDWRSPVRVGPRVVVMGRGVYECPDLSCPAPPAYVWTTLDGRSWEGGPLPGAYPSQPQVVLADDELVLGRTADERFRLARWTGGGWVAERVEGVGRAPGDQITLGTGWRAAGRLRISVLQAGSSSGLDRYVLERDAAGTWRRIACEVGCSSVQHAGDLLAAGDRVSLDGGRSWREADLGVPAPNPEVRELTVDPDGGWFAVVASNDTRGDHDWLVHSDDGRRWRVHRLPTCPSSMYRGIDLPVRLGGRWVVVQRCVDLNTPVASDVVRLTADGFRTDLHRRHVQFLAPAVLRGRLVVPVYDPTAVAVASIELVG